MAPGEELRAVRLPPEVAAAVRALAATPDADGKRLGLAVVAGQLAAEGVATCEPADVSGGVRMMARLTPELAAELSAYAARHGATTTDALRGAIAEGLRAREGDR